jgi:hypothetical protein
MYYDIVSSDIVNGRIRLLDFFEMGWVGRSSKTVREENSGEKKAPSSARGGFPLAALRSPQLVHLNCKEPSGLGILL